MRGCPNPLGLLGRRYKARLLPRRIRPLCRPRLRLLKVQIFSISFEGYLVVHGYPCPCPSIHLHLVRRSTTKAAATILPAAAPSRVEFTKARSTATTQISGRSTIHLSYAYPSARLSLFGCSSVKVHSKDACSKAHGGRRCRRRGLVLYARC